MIASILPQDEIGPVGVADVMARGPAVLGGLVALAAYLGLRSGVHGGPLVFEAPTVQYILQSPVDRAFVARRAALKQLRTAVMWGTAGGVGLGLAVTSSLGGNPIEFAAGFGVVGALAGLMLFGSALIASGRTLTSITANVAGLILIGWSIGDMVFATTTSPFTLIGRIGLWGLDGTPLTIIGVAVVAVVVFEGVSTAGGFSLEASQRRAGLISQIRFALTMKDLRTVVLLRRRLTNRGYRSQPWFPIGRSTGNRFPVLRRTMQSHVRRPLPALVRLGALGIGAGITLGLAGHGIAALALVSGLLLFVAGYDFIEPLAQEVDHPGRWATYPMEPGDLVVRLTLAGAVFMMPLALLGALVVSAVGGLDMIVIAFVIFPLATIAAAVGSAVSTLMGGPEVSPSAMASSEVFGISVVLRIALPPAVAILPFVPVAAGLINGSPPGPFLANSAVLVGAATGVAWLWLSKRSPGLL